MGLHFIGLQQTVVTDHKVQITIDGDRFPSDLRR